MSLILGQKNSFWIVLVVFVLVVSYALVSNLLAGNDPKITNQSVDEMAQTYGFVQGQQASLNELAKKFPEHAQTFATAKAKFELAFDAAVTNINRLLAENNTTWATTKVSIEKQLAANTKNPDVTLQQALDFAKTVESRVEGKIPSPFLQTLLMCRPDFRASPSEEFSRGFKTRYECDGTGKAKGIRFGIHYPLSWKVLDGSRPNIVQKFISENGRGLEMVMIQVKSLPDDLISEVKTEKQVAEFFSPETMKDMTPEGAKFIKSEKIKIDGVYGATLEYTMEEQRLTETVKLRSITYFLLFKDSLVSVICQAGGSGSLSEVELEARFQKFLPLFKMMANGFSLNNQWERTAQ
jgi:hypothetical protein